MLVWVERESTADIMNEASGPNDSPFADRRLLADDYVPGREGIVGREEEIAYLDDAVNPVIFGRDPADVLLYGPVGTGKSLCARYVVDRQVRYAAEQGFEAGFAVVDALAARTEVGVVRSFARRLNDSSTDVAVPDRGVGLAVYEQRLRQILDRRYDVALLVLDHVEYFDQQTLARLVERCSHQDTCRIAIVSISDVPEFVDTLSAETRERLGGHEFRYEPYDPSELHRILDSRRDAFVAGALGPAAADRIVSLATAAGGARSVVQLMRAAGEVARAAGRSRVEPEDVSAADRRVRADRVTERLQSLPPHAWYVLEALRSLTAGIDGPPRTAAVDERYRELCGERGVEALSDRRVRELLTEFDRRDLTEKAWQTGGRATGNFSTHRLLVDGDAVSRALSDAPVN
jgi:cell division control protein 6